jgi:hypothetical protein
VGIEASPGTALLPLFFVSLLVSGMTLSPYRLQLISDLNAQHQSGAERMLFLARRSA